MDRKLELTQGIGNSSFLAAPSSPLFTDQCQPVADRRWAYLLVFAGQSSQSASPMAKVPLWRGGIG